MKKRLSIYITFILVVSVALIFILFQGYKSFQSDYLNDLKLITGELALHFESSFDNVDNQQATDILKSSEVYPRKKILALLNRQGKIEHSSKIFYKGKDIRQIIDVEPSFFDGSRESDFEFLADDLFYYLTPIKIKSETKYLFIAYDIKGFNRNLLVRLLRFFVIFMCSLISGMIFLSMFFEKYFILPYTKILKNINSPDLITESELKTIQKWNVDAGVIAVELIRQRQRVKDLESKINKTEIHNLQAQKLQVIGQMAASIAHEVKNPLAFISMLSDSILGTDKNNPNIQEFTKVKEASDRANELLKDLLQFSRLEDAHKEIDVHQLLNNIANVNRIFLKGRGHSLILELGASRFKIIGNPIKLQQIFSNLISNASDAIPEDIRGIVEIRTFNNNDRLIVSVSDNGIGISENHQSKIFHNFFTTKEGKKGTGLGLGVVKQLISEHSADIWFETEQGTGTTFYTNFPTISG
ncbi:MAG: hypothetical protein OHK0056_09190 [Bacteriovoracaceae bacterium]